MTSQGATAPGLLLFLAGAGAIAAQAWRQITTYPKRKQKHRREVIIYCEKLEENDRKKSKYERELKASQSPERVVEFQYKLLLDILRRTVSHDGNGSKARIGNSEAMFEDYLKKYFPNKIQTKLKVQNPNYSKNYHYTLTG